VNATQLKGKRIAKVHQHHWAPGGGHPSAWIIEAIEFTDGTWLRFVVVEGEADYGVEGIYPARPLIKGENTK
jgi:hypothetical protein